MRSPREILFRGKQELANLGLWLRPPRMRHTVSNRAPDLPEPEMVASRLRESSYSEEVIRLADRLVAHDFPILGISLSTGPDIRWRRDYLNGKETDVRYFRRIPYLDASIAGDHKIIWELNRHQHLVLLAQAFALTGRAAYVDEISAQLESWLDQNPCQCGINWASALEVGFRALSWMWVHHIAGTHMEQGLRGRFLDALYQHGIHLQLNLSYYFSRNTHLLGEAVALHALGRLFVNCPRAAVWAQTGAGIVRAELDFQVFRDGAHFEQSTYYHLYALDLFTLHYLLAGRPPEYRPVLTKMAEYLYALLGVAGSLPFLGDDDGGRIFHPYGDHARYGRATLATCSVLLDRGEWLYDAADLPVQAAWWLGEETWGRALATHVRVVNPASRIFPDTGIVVMCAGERQVIVDAGPFGSGRAGHSHSDSLSVIARDGEAEILVDAGTFTYVGDLALRNWFRGSAAHNVIRVNEQDQGIPAGPFAWASKPDVRIIEWRSADDYDFLDADCRHNGVGHRRRVMFLKPALLVILDDVSTTGPSAKIEQIWHFGEDVSALSAGCYRIASCARFTIASGSEAALEFGGHLGWRSRALGRKEQAYALCITHTASVQTTLAAVLDFTTAAAAAAVEGQMDGETNQIVWTCGSEIARIRFRQSGVPESELF
jgi:hypothetical protein